MDSFSDIKSEIKDIRETTQKNVTALRVLETTVVEKHIAIIEKIEKIASDIERVVELNASIYDRVEEEIQYKLSDLRSDLTTLRDDLVAVKQTVNELSELATNTKASMKTIWVIGGLIAGAIGLFSGFIPGFK